MNLYRVSATPWIIHFHPTDLLAAGHSSVSNGFVPLCCTLMLCTRAYTVCPHVVHVCCVLMLCIHMRTQCALMLCPHVMLSCCALTLCIHASSIMWCPHVVSSCCALTLCIHVVSSRLCLHVVPHVVSSCCALMLWPDVVTWCCALTSCIHVVPSCCALMLWIHVVPSCCACMLCPQGYALMLSHSFWASSVMPRVTVYYKTHTHADSVCTWEYLGAQTLLVNQKAQTKHPASATIDNI